MEHKSRGAIFQSELIMNYIFDKLGMEDKINLSLCNKKINSFFNKRTKILKTSIPFPHSNYLQEIKIPLLNKISCKYTNIKKVETLFGSENEFKILADLNLTNNLEILNIRCITSNIESIGKFINLKQLYLCWNYRQDEVTNLSFLSHLVNLEILKLRDGKITDIEPIKGLTNLKELSMINIKKGSNKKNEESNDNCLFHFDGYNIEKLDITPISFLLNLEKLEIDSYINSIEPIKQLINLKELYLSGNEGISDISLLSNLVNLKKLRLSGLEIKNIEPIKYLVNLEKLELGSLYYISDVSPISYLINLKVLDIPKVKLKDLNLI